MSFLRKMFSGKVGTDDPRRFLVEAMLGAMEADGDVTEEDGDDPSLCRRSCGCGRLGGSTHVA